MRCSVDSVIEELPREGRDVDFSRYIESSQQVPSEASARKARQYEDEYLINLFPRTRIVTSTVTSFVVTSSTTVVTNSNFAASGALSCVPATVSIC